MMLRRLLLLLFLLVSAVPATAETQRVVLGDGRSYRIDLPPDPRGAPVILALHGGGGNPEQFARNSGLSGPATAAGYAVVYPAGSGRGPLLTWNGGYCCGFAARGGVDDLSFLDAVAADAARRFGLDGRRLYLTGMSNGSLMAEAYAASRPGWVRAVAGVAGTMDLSHRVAGPVALLHIHGTADDRVPFAGGPGKGTSGTDFAPVEALVAAFRAANRTLARPETRALASQGLAAREQTWRDAAGRPAVRLITIEGGGHVWPGGRRDGRRDAPSIDANAEILWFFGQHR